MILVYYCFYDFFTMKTSNLKFLQKKRSRNRGRKSWNLEWDDPGISSETTWRVGGIGPKGPLRTDFQTAFSRVVSLEIPGSSHSRFPGRSQSPLPVKQIRKTENPLLRRKVSGCRQTWSGQAGTEILS